MHELRIFFKDCEVECEVEEMKKSILCCLIAIFLCLSGCATTKTQDMLNSRMHKMNYEEALPSVPI